MNELTPFQFESSEVRIIPGESPLFIAADLAKILGYRDARDALRCVEEDEKGTQIVRTPGGDQEMSVVTESGLYALILRSRRAEAIKFRKWVTSEVLPSIRRTGSYSVAADARIPKSLTEALRLAADLNERAEAAEAKVAELEPKAAAFEAFLATKNDFSVTEAAQILVNCGVPTGRDRLHEWMREKKWTHYDGAGALIPYQTKVDAGYLRLVPVTYDKKRKDDKGVVHKTGEVGAGVQIRVTVAGLRALARAFGVLPQAKSELAVAA